MSAAVWLVISPVQSGLGAEKVAPTGITISQKG